MLFDCAIFLIDSWLGLAPDWALNSYKQFENSLEPELYRLEELWQGKCNNSWRGDG